MAVTYTAQGIYWNEYVNGEYKEEEFNIVREADYKEAIYLAESEAIGYKEIMEEYGHHVEYSEINDHHFGVTCRCRGRYGVQKWGMRTWVKRTDLK